MVAVNPHAGQQGIDVIRVAPRNSAGKFAYAVDQQKVDQMSRG